MNIRQSTFKNITAIHVLRNWINKYQIDTTNNLQRIFCNAAALVAGLRCIKIDSENDSNFNQKLFYTLLDMIENKDSGVSLEGLYKCNDRLFSASHAIPLKKLKKYVSVTDIRAALELHTNIGIKTTFAPIDQAQVAELNSFVGSTSEDRILLNEKQLALLVQLVFSSVQESAEPAASSYGNENKENEQEEFEHEDADEKAKALIRLNQEVPKEAVDLSIRIFGEQRAATLINLFNQWNISEIHNIPAISNLILLIPVKFVNIFSAALISFGWRHFNIYNLEKELDIIYKMVLTSNEKYLEKFIYALAWPFEHYIPSLENSMNILACEDFIEYFPKLKIGFINPGDIARCMTEDQHRNQKIFNLIIHHMQACERLYNFQNQHVFQLLNDVNVVPTNWGPDVSTLICEYNGTLETQGLFAKKYLRQTPTEQHSDLPDLLAGFKLK